MKKTTRAFKWIVLKGVLFWGLVTASLFSLLYPAFDPGLSDFPLYIDSIANIKRFHIFSYRRSLLGAFDVDFY